MHRYALIAVAALFTVACDGDDKGSGDTGDTMTTPMPLEVTSVQLECDAVANEVTITPTYTNGTPADAIFNVVDKANDPNAFHEEHTFANGGDARTLAITASATDQTQDLSTIFNCEDHWNNSSQVLVIGIRAYDADGTLADCQVGAEPGANASPADAIADMFDASAGTPPSMPGDFASCGTDLTITY